MEYAKACHTKSDGAFDITSGVLRGAWDFSQARVPDQDLIEALLPRIGLDKVTLSGGRMHFAVAGMELDFRGLAKEYAADRLAEVCASMGAQHGFVDLAGRHPHRGSADRWRALDCRRQAPKERGAHGLIGGLYSDYGAIKGLLPFDQQSQQLFGVVDYRIHEFNIEAGLGFGLTPTSDRLVFKLMVSRDLYRPLQKASEPRTQLQDQKPLLGSLPPPPWSPGN